MFIFCLQLTLLEIGELFAQDKKTEVAMEDRNVHKELW